MTFLFAISGSRHFVLVHLSYHETLFSYSSIALFSPTSFLQLLLNICISLWYMPNNTVVYICLILVLFKSVKGRIVCLLYWGSLVLVSEPEYPLSFCVYGTILHLYFGRLFCWIYDSWLGLFHFDYATLLPLTSFLPTRSQLSIALGFPHMQQVIFLLLLSEFFLLSFSIFLWCLWVWISTFILL